PLRPGLPGPSPCARRATVRPRLGLARLPHSVYSIPIPLSRPHPRREPASTAEIDLDRALATGSRIDDGKFHCLTLTDDLGEFVGMEDRLSVGGQDDQAWFEAGAVGGAARFDLRDLDGGLDLIERELSHRPESVARTVCGRAGDRLVRPRRR